MTRFNNKYPYTDFHELNADWLLETVKDAADTVDGYDGRLTSAEGAITTLQSEVETAGTGLLDRVTAAEGDIDALEADMNTPSTGLKARMTAAEGDIDTLQNEVETPSTGLLDRVTALENAPATTANAVYYLEFDSSLVSIDPDNAYDSRIKYDWLKQFVPLNVSGEDTHVIKLYDSHTQKVYDLAAFHLQESVSPDGKFVFTNRAEHTTGGVIDYYVDSTVTVLQNGTNPTFAEVQEPISGSSSTPINITPATNITIISNKSKRVGNTVIIDFSFSTDAIINANDFIVTTQFIAPGNAAPNYFVTQSNVPVSQRMLLNVNGYLSTAESITQGVTIVVNYRYEV